MMVRQLRLLYRQTLRCSFHATVSLQDLPKVVVWDAVDDCDMYVIRAVLTMSHSPRMIAEAVQPSPFLPSLAECK